VRNICIGGRWIDLYDSLNEQIVTIRDNLINEDVGLVVTPQGVRFRKGAPPPRIGTIQIPFEKIGLYPDPYRKRSKARSGM
ncbi:MAG: hypothetical protein NZ749_09685, partial [bacterium]|nr:hypothetical protein [bacterium]